MGNYVEYTTNSDISLSLLSVTGPLLRPNTFFRPLCSQTNNSIHALQTKHVAVEPPVDTACDPGTNKQKLGARNMVYKTHVCKGTEEQITAR